MSARRVSPQIARSWLLVPASHPELFAIAQASEADAIIIDLEDAVAANDKRQARKDTVEWLSTGHRAWVRINDASSDFWSEDCAALKTCAGLEGVMLAKSESASHLDDTSDRLPDDTRILALVETARGMQNVARIASAQATFRIAFGTGDFKRDTAVGEDPMALAYARSQLVIASRAARLPAPIDGPTLNIAHLPTGTAHAKEMGMSGKLCLTHEHAAVINAGLSPSRDDIAWAHGFIAAFEASGGTITDGSDLPRLARAQKIVAQAEDFGIDVPAADVSHSGY
ncbi:HpcH/HpaI aldolase OS=Tsukamurella paurometabola (strain ATCC 8368 / DSM / CCUG 35730 / CIP 100753 / JCM 10117 / KCTC 9821 / NBRC 16120 / NCIMB 702349 /NCTC 13040) OX=521096 GN=Tpau_2688 PE=4 SV=1 [Tsukamurella paurometabola]|uniref:HpcH/HpaI aldolase n=1 Tax=Tsukamurella paurometabola (strain ATCC 8368 / DSM 20162 / CCUG 35730 / CIP 100753 / JCM 10117 / KCTC 9821 / NBRC 16120 / NCIMB 702349 / NCTC 13040) TaxID=521096 RepID=D5USL7_TSUPD|nr:CoA ester lyase [Tsukamurella paurometabola]ADG79288.1 HpcH/HpaI aldolase [Tsukamurella paurometabola DSM 20162]SUP34929.1 (3S)-malyl-CoA thioesterase [Tsukamurella paurometabola]